MLTNDLKVLVNNLFKKKIMGKEKKKQILAMPI